MKTDYGCEYIPFDAYRYDFVTVVEELFGEGELEDLHEVHSSLFQVGDDSKTSFHKAFYDRYRSGWPEMEAMYSRFISEFVSKLFQEDFLYQKFPTFRVHLQGNVAVGAFHTDAEFKHPAGEVNFIIPLTNSIGSASVWLESAPGKGDYRPMNLFVGELVRFNGNTLSHGNKVNTTDKARVSMDFRVLPVSCYHPDEGDGVSVTRGTKFVEGGYYRRFRKNVFITQDPNPG